MYTIKEVDPTSPIINTELYQRTSHELEPVHCLWVFYDQSIFDWISTVLTSIKSISLLLSVFEHLTTCRTQDLCIVEVPFRKISTVETKGHNYSRFSNDFLVDYNPCFSIHGGRGRTSGGNTHTSRPTSFGTSESYYVRTEGGTNLLLTRIRV